jgi:uncharacterized radical SAM protein YgiQ
MFLPTTLEEVKQIGWDALDVILISGDSYIDSPYIGISVIGHILVEEGFRVGIIAQPDLNDKTDISRLGEPLLYWGVTGGSIDSMVANYTASMKKRRQDDYTPGGENNLRPDRAVIAYSNLIRKYFKNTRPIVLGGLEASLRRIAHYDFWSDRIRRSILFDSKANFLIYGMAERSVVEFTQALSKDEKPENIRGVCYISKIPIPEYLNLPSYEQVSTNKIDFIEGFHTFYKNNDPLTAKGLNQQHGDRYLIQNPPAFYLNQDEIDRVYALPYERQQHPYYAAKGSVKALETIQFSINTHRGCYGECNFCAIAVHEGRTIRWRSQNSIVSEAKKLTEFPGFRGYIRDIGGPTANMYGFDCKKKLTRGVCADRRCLFPVICTALRPDHQAQINLLEAVRNIDGIKKVFVASGIRYDIILNDRRTGGRYLENIVKHHVSGQLKLAPEHTSNSVLNLMGKPGADQLLKFKKKFDALNEKYEKNQFLTYYFIAAHPGCDEKDMKEVREFTSRQLKVHPEQVQIFTPTPSTYASVMYYTEINPFTMQPIFVEKSLQKKNRQKEILVKKVPGNK